MAVNLLKIPAVVSSHRFAHLGCSRMQGQSHCLTRQLKYVSSRILRINQKGAADAKTEVRNSDKTKRFRLHPAENMIPLLSNAVSVLQRAEKEENYAKYLNNRVYRCGLRRRGDSFAYRTATAWGCRVRRWMVEKVTGSQSGQVGGGETSVWNSCLQTAEFAFTFGLHFIFYCSRFSWSFLISEALYCSQAGRKSS